MCEAVYQVDVDEPRDSGDEGFVGFDQGWEAINAQG